MPKPFNFYQQISGLVFSEGAPTPFGLFFVNTSGIYGVYFPQHVALGDPLYLSNDGDIAPTRFRIKVSGKLDNVPKDSYQLSSSFSGNKYPAPPDSQNFYVSQAGNISGNSPDIVGLYIPITGRLDNIPLDIFGLNNNISGKVDLCPLDLEFYKIIPSGNIINYDNELFNFKNNIKGNLRAKPQDKEKILFNLQSMSFEPGINEVDYQDSDLENFVFGINTITFSKSN